MEILAGLGIVILVVVGIGGVIVLSALVNGWTLSILWKWFMVPVFGLPMLSIPQAIGIAMVIGYLTFQNNDAQEKERSTTERVIFWVALIVLRPLITLAFGWIVHQYM